MTGTGRPQADVDPTGPSRRPVVVAAGLLRSRAADATLWMDVAGTSMGRTVPDGSRVRIEPRAVPRRGEVWAFFTRDGNLFVHRSRGPAGDLHRFQGDARARPDDPVPTDHLVGRVVEIAGRGAPRGPAFGALQRWPRTLVATIGRVRRRTG